MTERVVSFASRGRLTGVFTEPGPGLARADAPVVITSNVGVHHHVGPYRFFVDLARELVPRGISTLRFDLSAFGDSAVRPDTSDELERAMDDYREAMRYLTARGHDEFLPIGFCSGVDPVHRVALEDRRVVAVCFIEGYAYETLGSRLRRPLRYLSRSRWRRLLARKMPPILRELPVAHRLGCFTEVFVGQDATFVREYPQPSALRRDYEMLSARGTRQLFVYAGSDGAYTYERQFLDFTRLRSLGTDRRVVFLPEADHTFFRVSDRADVIRHVCDWVDRDVVGGRPR